MIPLKTWNVADRRSMIGPNYPLIDLHRHLEGSLRLQTILELGEMHSFPIGVDLQSIRALVQVSEPQPDLVTYLTKNEKAITVLADLDACARVAKECIEDASREGLAYLELRFSPLFMAGPHRLNPIGVVEAVVDGVKCGERDFKVRTNLIGILSRNLGPQTTKRELEALLARREQIVALDLAGDEANWPGDLFVEHFKRARDVGWHITIHAGEAAGSEGIKQAICELGAERIGHGIRATGDTLSFLAEQQVGLEVSLTSNVQTSTVSNYNQHPLRSFLERGILATINTDNPTASGITLPYELTVAASSAGLSPALVQQAQSNAVEIAFLSEEDKMRLRTIHKNLLDG